ncbi:MAG: RnfABCDGE type electron transport complex subunit G [Bacteroidales bacterium]|nr:RnfABCDGE type electron transport complex subunit G [Bacteroidales bacterium]
MMAAQSNLKNMVLCLTAVCFVCAAVLAATYAVTQEPIARTAQHTLQQSLAEVLPQDTEIDVQEQTLLLDGTSYSYYACTQDGRVQGWAIRSVTAGFGGPLTLLVGVRADGTVHAAKVLSHSETPGLGAKCKEDRTFTGQFKSFDPRTRKLAVRKDGGDIDAITASTITSRAYTLAVANAVKVAAALQDGTREEDPQNE